MVKFLASAIYIHFVQEEELDCLLAPKLPNLAQRLLWDLYKLDRDSIHTKLSIWRTAEKAQLLKHTVRSASSELSPHETPNMRERLKPFSTNSSHTPQLNNFAL